MSMNNQGPDVTDEEIGMRAFQIRKARAVERAIERLRKGLGGEWARLTWSQIVALSFVLGELWAYVAHTEWDELRFSTLVFEDVERIIAFSRELTEHGRNSVDVLKDVYALITAKG
jgi:hypothetical protein